MKLDLSRTKNIPEATAAGYPNDFVGVYVGDASLELPTKWFKKQNNQTLEIYGTDLLLGTGGISGHLGLRAVGGGPVGPNDELVFSIGGEENNPDKPGFLIGFKRFDIEFKQNSQVGSEIEGSITIPKLKDTLGNPAKIDVFVSIFDDGDFKITGREVEGLVLQIPNVLQIILKEATFGKEDDKFFFSVTGSLKVIHENIREYLKVQIDFKQLTIWEDGHIEIKGGGIQLPKPIELKIGPVKLGISAISLGSHEQTHAGIMRSYKYFGFDGGVGVNPGGVSAKGKGIRFCFFENN